MIQSMTRYDRPATKYSRAHGFVAPQGGGFRVNGLQNWPADHVRGNRPEVQQFEENERVARDQSALPVIAGRRTRTRSAPVRGGETGVFDNS